jgi:hypothetical protein
MLTVNQAKDRVVVQLPDGRTARLVSVPGRSRRHGDKAVVVLPSGAHLSVHPEQLQVVE